MKRVIPIRTNRDKFFRQVLELLRSLPPFNKLRPRELELLSKLMAYSDEFKALDRDSRYDLIFSTRTRRAIADDLDMSEDAFNNNLSILRRHGLLTKDNRFAPILEDLYYDSKFELTYKFVKE
jgi:hypothetical protein